MIKKRIYAKIWRASLGALLLTLPLAIPLAGHAEEATPADEAQVEIEVVIGGQGTSVDADDDRDGKFRTYRDEPNGLVLDWLRLLYARDDRYFLLESRDTGQDDESFLLRGGSAGKLRAKLEYTGVPFFYGTGARLPLQAVRPNEYRAPDGLQQLLEDPDGNGIPFFAEPGGVDGDNALAQGLMRQILASSGRFDVATRRRAADFELRWTASSEWSFELTASRDEKNGTTPLGKGSYQRITDVNGDGATDYDYFFSVRGIELPAPVDTTTETYGASVQLRKESWYGRLQAVSSSFDNEYHRLVYDNPFWFTDTLATSGIQRGLWEEGDAALFPDSDAFTLSFNGGVDLGDKTRLTGVYTVGEVTQDEPFVSLSTNTALIGTGDLNGDGVIDASDDPTSLSTLPRSSLDASTDTEVVSLRLTSSPTDRVRLKASYHSYDYDGADRPLLFPFRADYNNSRLRDNFHGADLIFIPYRFEREDLGVQGVFRLNAALRLAAFAERTSYDRPQYVDFTDDGTFNRDAGNRAVSSTDDDTIGATLFFESNSLLSGWVTYKTSEQDFSGTYQEAFDGEFQEVRQYDIARRDRDEIELQVDVSPSDRVTWGFGYRNTQDDYPETAYGLQQDDEDSFTVNVNWIAGDNSSVWAFGDRTESDAGMHLRTKCSNCSPPPGVDWTTPWGVPNFDWFSTYNDETMALGLGGDHKSTDGRHRWDFQVDWIEGTVAQTTRNPGPPIDLNQGTPVQVALGFDFPDQVNTLTSAQLRYRRKVNERWTCGVAYWYEKFELDDFMVDGLQPYGAEFLTTDDATRYLALDARYSDYEAQVGQLFVAVNF